MCVLGNRLLKDIDISDCNKTGGPLRTIFCGNSTDDSDLNCDPYWIKNNVSIVRGIKGLSSGVFLGSLAFSFFFF